MITGEASADAIADKKADANQPAGLHLAVMGNSTHPCVHKAVTQCLPRLLLLETPMPQTQGPEFMETAARLPQLSVPVLNLFRIGEGALPRSIPDVRGSG